MIRRFLLSVRCMLVWVVAGITVSATGQDTPRFAHETSDLKPDPEVRFGQLPNGLRYAVRANPEPKGRASLRLLVEAGSFHETEEQRGLAHFLEHLAFNGSTHYPPGTLIEFFQRMGMGFGADTNASTGFDRTLYLLELADTQPKTLQEGFQVLSDYTTGLLLNVEEIEKERGIILSEKRARDSIGFRSLVAQLNALYPETLLPKRLPIGSEEVIKQADRSRFTAFYDAWYSPTLSAVIAVGDFDPVAVEQLIIAAFSSFQARGPALAEPARGRVTSHEGLRAHYHHEVEAPQTTVTLTRVIPYEPESDTAAKRLSELPLTLAHAMLNRRFAELSKKENAPFLSANISSGDQFEIARRHSLDLNTKAEQWDAALAVGEQELRRALEHGFDPAELAEVRATFLNGLEQAVRTAPTRRSRTLANALANAILEEEVFTAPTADLALFKPALETVTVEQCLAALRKAWPADGRHVMVTGNALIRPESGTPADAIAAAYARAQAVPVASHAAIASQTWAYTQFGSPGQIAERRTVDDLGLVLVRFENGVRLNIKKTDFEAGRMLTSARVGHGQLLEPTDKPGLATMAEATFDAGGLGQHSVDDLRRVLAGKNVGWRLDVTPDALTLTGGTTPDDLGLHFQLLAAKLTDPGYRPESLRLAQRGLEQLYLSFEHTYNGPLSLAIAPLLANGDPRFGLPPKDIISARTLDEIRAWLEPQLKQGPVEIAVVGDLDVEAVIQAVAATVGALPMRQERQAHEDRRHVSFPAQPFAETYTIDSELPKALTVFYWPTTDGFDVHTSRRLNILAEVITDRIRLKIREELGLTYGASMRSFTSETFPRYGYLSTSIDVEPGRADEVVGVMRAIGAEVAAQGITDDELDRAKQPVLTSIRESVRTNTYWLNAVLAQAQERPQALEWARTREADLHAVSRDEIMALGREYLRPERLSHAVIAPQKKEESAPPPAPPTP